AHEVRGAVGRPDEALRAPPTRLPEDGAPVRAAFDDRAAEGDAGEDVPSRRPGPVRHRPERPLHRAAGDGDDHSVPEGDPVAVAAEPERSEGAARDERPGPAAAEVDDLQRAGGDVRGRAEAG